jgi:iron-sulfur cluster repair protein YtfE (RIC family)
MNNIHKGLTVGEVMHRFPETIEVFEKHELSFCAGCYVTLFSEIEKAAGYAAIKDVDQLIDDLKGLVDKLEAIRG